MTCCRVGHLLFEMMCGYELTTLSPSNGDLGNVRSEDQVEVSHHHGNTGVVVEL